MVSVSGDLGTILASLGNLSCGFSRYILLDEDFRILLKNVSFRPLFGADK